MHLHWIVGMRRMFYRSKGSSIFILSSTRWSVVRCSCCTPPLCRKPTTLRSPWDESGGPCSQPVLTTTPCELKPVKNRARSWVAILVRSRPSQICRQIVECAIGGILSDITSSVRHAGMRSEDYRAEFPQNMGPPDAIILPHWSRTNRKNKNT